jgi:hypothetical protein
MIMKCVGYYGVVHFLLLFRGTVHLMLTYLGISIRTRCSEFLKSTDLMQCAARNQTEAQTLHRQTQGEACPLLH